MGNISIEAKFVRFRCPHCGKVNKAPIECIGRGGSCVRCNGGVKVPAATGRNAMPVMKSVKISAAPETEATADVDRTARQTSAIFTDEDTAETDAEILHWFTPQLPIAKRSKPSATTLDELHGYLADAPSLKQNRKDDGKTPLWLWALHLALPIAAAWILISVYQARSASDPEKASSDPTAKVPSLNEKQ